MTNTSFTIEQVTSVSPEILGALNSLIPQLSQGLPSITDEDLQRIIGQKNTYLFVAREVQTNTIAGTLTLVTYQTPSGPRGYVEDVIVDDTYRGHGLGTMLMEKAIETSRNMHLEHIGLTSRPERAAANALYQKLGFVKRETNVYRLALK